MYVARLDRALNVSSIMIVEVFSHMPVNNVVRLRIGWGYCSASGTQAAAAVASGFKLKCDTKPNHHLMSGLNRTSGPDNVTMSTEKCGEASNRIL